MKRVILTFCSLALLSVSCKKDDTPTLTPSNEGSGKYLVKTTFKNPDGKSGSSYLQLTNHLNATTALNNKQAIQVPYMSSVMIYGNEVYSLDAIDGSYGVRKFIYNPTTQKLTESKKFDTPAHSMPCNLIKVSDTKAYLPLYNVPKVLIINPQTMQKTGEIDIQRYAHSDSSPDAGYGIIRDGYFYLPLLQLGPDYAPYADHLQSDVLIINVQTDKVEKVISETTTQLAMPSQPSCVLVISGSIPQIPIQGLCAYLKVLRYRLLSLIVVRVGIYPTLLLRVLPINPLPYTVLNI